MDYTVLEKMDVDDNAETAEACKISCKHTLKGYKWVWRIQEIESDKFEGFIADIDH